MKKYEHGKSTPFYKLRSAGYGDSLDPEIEYENLKILENQLLAGTGGVNACVFDDGEYLLKKITDKQYSVELCATGSNPSFKGIVFGGYCEGDSKIVWDGLTIGKIYYIYIKWSASLYVDKKAFRVYSSAFLQKDISGKSLLMAKVDLTGDNPSIDVYPDGKIYARDIASHVADRVNPHGFRQVQDELLIRKKLLTEINDKTDNSPAWKVTDNRDVDVPLIETNKEIILKDKRTTVALSDNNNDELSGESLIGAINSSAKIEVMDIVGDSEGELLSISSDKEVVSVSIHQRVVAGGYRSGVCVGVSYHGDDDEVDAPNKFKVFGETGVLFKATIFYK